MEREGEFFDFPASEGIHFVFVNRDAVSYQGPLRPAGEKDCSRGNTFPQLRGKKERVNYEGCRGKGVRQSLRAGDLAERLRNSKKSDGLEGGGEYGTRRRQEAEHWGGGGSVLISKVSDAPPEKGSSPSAFTETGKVGGEKKEGKGKRGGGRYFWSEQRGRVMTGEGGVSDFGTLKRFARDEKIWRKNAWGKTTCDKGESEKCSPKEQSTDDRKGGELWIREKTARDTLRNGMGLL